MTKQISLCNLVQSAFTRRAFVPPRETNPLRLSRRWEQVASGLQLQQTMTLLNVKPSLDSCV